METAAAYLTTDDLAVETHTPAETLRYWRYMGRGPKSFKIGRRVLYARTDVDEWLQAARDGAQA